MKTSGKAGGRRIFVDMDGVVADYEAGALGANCSPELYKLRQGAYRDLPLIPGAREAMLDWMEAGWEVWLATKPPSENAHAASEKVFWIQEHLPELSERYIITFHKGMLGRKQDFLIDDRPHKAHCNEFAGTFLHYGQDPRALGWAELSRHFATLSSQATC